MEVVLPLETNVSEFVLAAYLPDAVKAVAISCRISGELVGAMNCDAPGPFEFHGLLPPFAAHEPVLRLEFAVDSAFSDPGGDPRELGICVPIGAELPFRIV